MAWLLGCLALAAPDAQALTFVLEPDGTGDVATFQAGLDSLAARADLSAWPSDTLVVQPGDYQEDPAVTVFGARWLIRCPGGPERTRLRSMTVHGAIRMRIDGLGIAGNAELGTWMSFTFVDCIFDGYVHVRHDFSPDPDGRAFVRCVFRGRSNLNVTGWLDSCRFEGPAHIQTSEDPVILHACEFAGQDTAVTTRGEFMIRFTGCRFADVTRGIVYRGMMRLEVVDCVFRDVREAAIGLEDPPAGEPWVPRFVVTGSRFEGCGAAVRVKVEGASGYSGSAFWLEMSADTIADSRAASVSLSTPHSGCDLKDLRVIGSGGAGIALEGVFAAAISRCVVAGSRADGVHIELATRWAEWASFSNNTLALNGGAGLSIAQEPAPDMTEAAVTVDGTILAGNRGDGLVTGVPYAITARRNDTWMNGGVPLSGLVDADSSLALDPQFCDFAAGDLHVTAVSPCSPSGPYGQIGALGADCDASAVGVDIVPGSPENVVPAGSSGVVPVAILSNPVLDARQVDPRSIRLAGATVVTKPPLRQRDVNADGLVDVVAHVEAEAMGLAPGPDTATLEAMTFYGAPLRGTDQVRVVPLRGAGATLAEAVEPAPRLAIQGTRSEGGRLVVWFSLPGPGAAVLELFDVAGRRVERCEVGGLGQGAHHAAFRLRTAGLYWLRLGQGAEVVTRTVVVLR